ncbi:MAG: hypothetical protein GJ680_02095 [Alteromonadaceae bacterium]|nr:hypothetical protein [Alteromonadaceae bacterium]
MTSKFDSERVQQQVTRVLDEANDSLSQQQLSDISQARMNALRLARAAKSTDAQGANLSWLKRHYQLATPVAVAVLLAVLVSYNQINTVPAIPAEMMLGEVPTEELALLEDLEFASWLAEQEQVGVL